MAQQVHSKWKRIGGGSLAAVMFLTALPSLPAMAAEDTTTNYYYDDYDIEYSVVGSWEGHKNILVTVRNNTEEPMYNWAFQYDAAGTISEIWGAQTIDSRDSEYVIGGLNYNNRISSSVTFGYILECEDDAAAPSDFTLCSKRVDLDEADYEAVGTEVRPDLGDSIKKAFNNVDALIEEAGLSPDDENRRAVRILGYSGMEINEENIGRIKEADNRVNSMIESLTPKNVLRLIRENINPLNMNIDELNEKLASYEAEEEE